jgi:hypothetical protein
LYLKISAYLYGSPIPSGDNRKKPAVKDNIHSTSCYSIGAKDSSHKDCSYVEAGRIKRCCFLFFSISAHVRKYSRLQACRDLNSSIHTSAVKFTKNGLIIFYGLIFKVRFIAYGNGDTILRIWIRQEKR